MVVDRRSRRLPASPTRLCDHRPGRPRTDPWQRPDVESSLLVWGRLRAAKVYATLGFGRAPVRRHSGRRSQPGARVGRSAVPTEAALHEVLMRHPTLVPASDLGFDRMVTVGFETSLASGSADLVAARPRGTRCLVEVKKEGNPDTRRVIAQLLDYAAALWGMALDEFERRVLRPQLGERDPRDLRQFIADELLDDGDEEADDATQRVLDGLGETLRAGDFALVVAAPVITEGVQRVIEYLNARGMSVYGLEVSYFAGEVEAFVPRIVARPSVGVRIAGQDSRGASATVQEPETFLASLPEMASGHLDAFLAGAAHLGGEVQWRAHGPRVRVRGTSGPKVVATFDKSNAYLTIGSLKGIPDAPRREAAASLQDVPAVNVGPLYGSLNWGKAPEGSVSAFFKVGLEFVRALGISE